MPAQKRLLSQTNYVTPVIDLTEDEDNHIIPSPKRNKVSTSSKISPPIIHLDDDGNIVEEEFFTSSTSQKNTNDQKKNEITNLTNDVDYQEENKRYIPTVQDQISYTQFITTPSTHFKPSSLMVQPIQDMLVAGFQPVYSDEESETEQDEQIETSNSTEQVSTSSGSEHRYQASGYIPIDELRYNKSPINVDNGDSLEDEELNAYENIDSIARNEEINKKDCSVVGKQIRLFPHQQRALNVIAENQNKDPNAPGMILGMYMGLGKTLTSLSYIYLQDKKTNLVVCSKANLDTWKTEIEKFFGYKMDYVMYHSSYDSKFFETKLTKAGIDDAPLVVITTYDYICLYNSKNNNHFENKTAQVKAKAKAIETFLFKNEWDTIIYDEVGKLLKPRNKTHVSAVALKASYKLILSGTPVINNSNEIWSLMSVLGFDTSSYAHNLDSFISCGYNNYVYMVKLEDVDIILPKLIDTYITIEANPDMKLVYNELRNLFITTDNAGKKSEEARNKVIGIISMMRQCCNNPLHFSDKIEKYIGKETMQKIRERAEESAKMQKAKQLINQHVVQAKQKMLIFSQFTQPLQEMNEYCKINKIKSAVYDGNTPDSIKNQLVRKFNNSSVPFVMMMNIVSANEGLNLQSADVVIIMEPAFNAAKEIQAIARMHRIGCKNEKTAYHLLVEKSFEMYSVAIQYRKELDNKRITTKQERKYGNLEKTSFKDSIHNSEAL